MKGHLHLEGHKPINTENFGFSAQILNLQARSCGKHLLGDQPHDTVEIVQWFKRSGFRKKDYCITIAYFVRDKEGYNLHFVGKRPIDEGVDWNNFKTLFQLSNSALEMLFTLQENERREQE